MTSIFTCAKKTENGQKSGPDEDGAGLGPIPNGLFQFLGCPQILAQDKYKMQPGIRSQHRPLTVGVAKEVGVPTRFVLLFKIAN